VCSCRPSRGSGWTCSRADGKTCDCVGQFGGWLIALSRFLH
jgi:hypothetical protein